MITLILPIHLCLYQGTFFFNAFSISNVQEHLIKIVNKGITRRTLLNPVIFSAIIFIVPKFESKKVVK